LELIGISSATRYLVIREHSHLLHVAAASSEVPDLDPHETGGDGRELESSNGAKDGDAAWIMSEVHAILRTQHGDQADAKGRGFFSMTRSKL
jgi:hypothetical protein